MTNLPPSDAPDHDNADDDELRSAEPDRTEPDLAEPPPEPADEPEVTSTPVAAINPALSDDDLLAAASSFLHDESDMVNQTPGANNAGPSDNDASPGAAQPGAEHAGAMPPPPPGAPSGYPPPAGMRRLYRSRHDRRLGGVSAGIAEYLGIDPTLVRLVTLVAAFTGIGIFVYLAAWLIVPKRPDGFVDAPRMQPVADERTMTLAFGVAALALAVGITTGSWAVLAIALIGGGVWLLSEHTAIAPSTAGVVPGSGTSSYRAAAGYEPGYADPAQAGPYFATNSDFVPPAPASAPTRVRKPQRITWTVLSLLALLTAVGLAAASGDWWDVSATRFLGIGVVTIGVGVVVGQVRNGGARGLIPLGILGAIALLPVSAIDGLLGEGVGEANYQPTTITELETTYEHGIGEMTVDLSELDFEGRTDSIDIDLGIGELIVIVSEDMGGQAELQAKAGEVTQWIGDTRSQTSEEGINIETGAVSLQGDNGMVDLNISVGFGTAELRVEGN